MYWWRLHESSEQVRALVVIYGQPLIQFPSVCDLNSRLNTTERVNRLCAARSEALRD